MSTRSFTSTHIEPGRKMRDFPNFENLQSLYLYNANGEIDSPINLGSFINLKTLYIENVNFINVSNLFYLTSLYLKRIKIDSIDLYSLRNLKTLTFDQCSYDNSVKKINISHLQHLHTISMNGCGDIIRYHPNTYTGLKLKYLYEDGLCTRERMLSLGIIII
jgi:hypothetical protein